MALVGIYCPILSCFPLPFPACYEFPSSCFSSGPETWSHGWPEAESAAGETLGILLPSVCRLSVRPAQSTRYFKSNIIFSSVQKVQILKKIKKLFSPEIKENTGSSPKKSGLLLLLWQWLLGPNTGVPLAWLNVVLLPLLSYFSNLCFQALEWI